MYIFINPFCLFQPLPILNEGLLKEKRDTQVLLNLLQSVLVKFLAQCIEIYSQFSSEVILMEVYLHNLPPSEEM